jgi:hypothetical protein
VKRKRKIKGPFVATPLALLDAPAWRVMSLGARLLHIELRRSLRNDGLNNGKIFRSCRSAAKAIGIDKNTAQHGYCELEHYGFIRKTAPGFLGDDGRGIAAKFRFTDLAYGTHPATRDYEKWDGELFVYRPRRSRRKTQNPVHKTRTPRPQNPDIRNANDGGAVCPQNLDIDEGLRCPQIPDISRLPYPAPAGARIQGSSTVRAPAQAGDAGSSPAPVASLTEYVLSVVNAQLDELEGRRRANV